MSKILCIDIGNTNTKFAIFTDGSYEYLGYVPTCELSELPADGRQMPPLQIITKCIISSVVPSKTQFVIAMIRRNFGVEPILVPDDKGVGADILASMEYAKNHFELPCIVFSFGTATTVYVLGENGKMQGGLIIPGIEPSLEAMAVKAENLPEIMPYETDAFLEFSTKGAMNSGIIYGTAAQVEWLYKKTKKEYGIKTLILAGGYSGLISKYVTIPHIVERDIVLKGCCAIFNSENSNE